MVKRFKMTVAQSYIRFGSDIDAKKKLFLDVSISGQVTIEALLPF